MYELRGLAYYGFVALEGTKQNNRLMAIKGRGGCRSATVFGANVFRQERIGLIYVYQLIQEIRLVLR